MKGHPFVLVKDRNPTVNRHFTFINTTGFSLTFKKNSNQVLWPQKR